MKNAGYAIHCHHYKLIEWCWDYQERVDCIKKYKPEGEKETRLKLFQLLPDEAVEEIPLEWRCAEEKLREAEEKLRKANEKRGVDKNYWEEEKKRWEACKKWWEAYKKFREACKKWSEEAKKALHKKWCGCKNWNGKKLVF